MKNWSIIRSDPNLREVFPDPPLFSFRRAPSLKDKLVRSHLTPVQQSMWLKSPKGTFACGNCNHCTNIGRSTTFIDIHSNKQYHLKTHANCNTCFVVYKLECDCGCFYVGRTKRRLKDRLTEHKGVKMIPSIT